MWEELIGKTEEEARKLVESKDWSFRVDFRNGQPVPVTADMRANRINVGVENGIVTNIGCVQ